MKNKTKITKRTEESIESQKQEIDVLRGEIKELKILHQNLADMRVKAYRERDELRAAYEELLADNKVLYKFLLKQLSEGKV